MKELRKKAVYQSPLRLLIIFVVTIFSAEVIIMFLLHLLAVSSWIEVIADSFLLSIVLFPVLHFFVFRPLKLYVAELEKTEDSLKESEERFRTLVENAPEGFYVISADGTITSLNPAFEDITGFPRTEWVGKPFTDIIHRDDLPVAVKWFQQVLNGEKTPSLELRVLSKSGGYLIGEFVTEPLIKGGNIIGALGIAHNITERKQAEELLRTTHKELLEKTAELERFNRFMVGRELEMIRLKAEVNELLEKSGQPGRYETPERIKKADA